MARIGILTIVTAYSVMGWFRSEKCGLGITSHTEAFAFATGWRGARQCAIGTRPLPAAVPRIGIAPIGIVLTYAFVFSKAFAT